MTDVLFRHLKASQMLCPFAVSPRTYQITHDLEVNALCWFVAEKNNGELGNNTLLRHMAGCALSGSYGKCSVYNAIDHV